MLQDSRRGLRPATSDDGPHRQLEQTAPPEVWGTLVARTFALPGVVEGHSQVSPASSRAVFLTDLHHEVDPKANLAPGQRLEPVHLHGVQDTSVHLVLPKTRGDRLVELGWAEPHQYSEFETEFMIYGPRDGSEVERLLSVIAESLDFARGGAPTQP